MDTTHHLSVLNASHNVPMSKFNLCKFQSISCTAATLAIYYYYYFDCQLATK